MKKLQQASIRRVKYYEFTKNIQVLRHKKLQLSYILCFQAKKAEEMPKASEGYGGKFGVQTDRMDKVKLNQNIFYISA